MCPDPFAAYNLVAAHGEQQTEHYAGCAGQVASGSQVMAGAVIGDRVVVGNDCVIHPNVVVRNNTIIGDRVVIWPNTTIGADAFYFKKTDQGRVPLRSIGGVVIESGVTIGANCTINRGVSSLTRIGVGTVIDANVHIGHGADIGRSCLIAAQTGIAGKVVVEDEVVLWGQAGVTSGVSIGRGTVVFGQSGVTKSLAPGQSYMGCPARDAYGYLKELARLRDLARRRP